MRIPLDYYRILGLPIQATAEQLKQAHRDRTLQLPRREYSEVAIEARKQLIDEAYGVLSKADSRKEYDARFLANAYIPEPTPEGDTGTALRELNLASGEAALRSLAAEPSAADPYAPTIDISGDQFVGALLILLELGEYEQVIRLGRPYLSSGNGSLSEGLLGDPNVVLADTVLTVALACLELGREQWQQRQYEVAAESLETGHELLVKENLFASIRAEIQTELYKLRPYRILELLARPTDQTRERRQGIKLLKSMLEDRGGIEGTEDDLSGLSIDDFLRFIQQLRDYLTTTEQQELFEAESRRPSAVATYLTVYALLARGFARHQPALIRRAKQLLMRVGTHQDVHLEQAVCALLLGQTEEASRALELSQEYEPLAFIREHSQAAPDLLPGLCLYAERWLRDEVFPHFRDLQQQQATLKEYFANPAVQAYLETMPPEANTTSTPLSIPQLQRGNATPMPPSRMDPVQPHEIPPPPSSAPSAAELNVQRPWPRTVSSTPTAPPSAPTSAPRSTPAPPPEPTQLSVAERISQLSPEGKLEAPDGPSGSKRAIGSQNGRAKQPPAFKPPAPERKSAQSVSTASRRAASPRWGRLVMLFLAGLVGMGLLGFMTTRVLSWMANGLTGPKIEGQPLAIRLDRPAIEIPDAPTEAEQISVNDIAERTINRWLEAKREALGPDHNVSSLETALTDPALTQWRRRAEAAERENWYWEYEHTLEVQSVEPNDPTADALQATVTVTEAGQYFELGVENTEASYNDTLTMRYDLVRQDGEWLVKDANQVD